MSCLTVSSEFSFIRRELQRGFLLDGTMLLVKVAFCTGNLIYCVILWITPCELLSVVINDVIKYIYCSFCVAEAVECISSDCFERQRGRGTDCWCFSCPSKRQLNKKKKKREKNPTTNTMLPYHYSSVQMTTFLWSTFFCLLCVTWVSGLYFVKLCFLILNSFMSNLFIFGRSL